MSPFPTTPLGWRQFRDAARTPRPIIRHVFLAVAVWALIELLHRAAI